MTDYRRNMEKKVNGLLGFFPVVIILGVRQCGKTTLAKWLRSDWHYVDLERGKDFDFVTGDFEFFIREHPHNVGFGFEAFITEEVIKGIQCTNATNWRYYYFRSRNGAEIDLILEGPFGILPIEIKFGSTVKRRQLQTIINFVRTNNLPLGIVINNSDRVELISDRIIQLPATYI